MYPRHCEWRKHGKRHTCWALVEAYRTARGSRQRVVADLGELKPTEAVGGAQLGAHLDGLDRGMVNDERRDPRASLLLQESCVADDAARIDVTSALVA